MGILNRTRNTILVKDIETADSAFRKAVGLMFRKELRKGRGLLMNFGRDSRPGIWMLGMRFPIDLVFIDRRKRVVDLREGIKPMSLNPGTWCVHYPRKSVRYVLELNKGMLKRTGTGIGDVLEFQA